MSIKNNIIANFSGTVWATLMSLAFTPFYIKLLGMESYGIIGVFMSLVGILAILDLGLSQAMIREMARLSSSSDKEQLILDTARTLELVFWFMAVGITGIVILLADSIATYWLNPETLSRDTLRQAIWIMSAVIGLRWPISIYAGGLNGLQRQVILNVVLVIFATLQGAGALAVLWFIEPTISAFFKWQAVTSILQVAVLRVILWRCFPPGYKGSFSQQVLKNIWEFAAGMTGIAVVATILTQLDKVLLSRLLSLTDFGYYAFASSVAMVAYRIIGPVFTAYYPKMTSLVTKGDQQELVRTFHQGCQVMAVTLLPFALLLAFFSKEILSVWTRNPDLVLESSILVSLLIIGNAINGLMHMPYALQLSHGWTKLAIYQNVIAIVILVPATYFATQRWGAIGAAGVWVLLNCGYLLVGVHFMFRRMLSTEKLKWYVNDVAKILMAALLVLAVAKYLYIEESGDLTTVSVLVVSLGVSMVLAFISADKLTIQRLIPSKMGEH